MHRAETSGTRRGGLRVRISLRAVRIGLGLALTLALLGFVAAMALLPAFGYERQTISGSSMSGSIEQGSVAFTREVPVRQLAVGDVITYIPPRAGAEPLTHRITWIGRDSQGLRTFRTKGDANPARDPWTFHLNSETQPRVEYSLPFAGKVMTAMADPGTRALVLLFFALIVVGRPLRRLWRDAGPGMGQQGGTPGLTPAPEES